MPSGAEIFRRAFQERDFESLFDALAPDFRFYHVGQVDPSPPGPFLRIALPLARDVLGDDFRFTDHLHGDVEDLLPWTATIDSIGAEGVDIVREDAEARLLEVRITMRPAPAIVAFGEAMKSRAGAFHDPAGS